MKRLVLPLLLLVATSLFAGIVKRGAPLSDAKPTPLAELIANPEAYKDKPVLVEGIVSAACTEMGCWMQLAPEGSKQAIHITFKDRAFFVPTDAKGMKARAEGLATVETLSKEEVDHLNGEGAELKRAEDGTAKQITFVATGVELQK